MKIDAKTCYEGIFPIYQQIHGAQHLWKAICDISNRILGRKIDDPDYLRDFTYGIITILPVVGTVFNLFLYVVIYRNIPIDQAPVKVEEKGKEELSQASEELEDPASEEPPPPPPPNYPNIDKTDLNVVIKALPDPEDVLPVKVVTPPAVEPAKEEKPQDKPTEVPPPVAASEEKPSPPAPPAIEELKKPEKKTFRRAFSAILPKREKSLVKPKGRKQQIKDDAAAEIIK